MTKPKPLTETEVKSFLSASPSWHLEAGALTQTFDCVTFVRAIAFVEEIAAAAEAANHHPDIDIRYNKVKLGLITHDAGNALSVLDTALAAQCDTRFKSLP